MVQKNHAQTASAHGTMTPSSKIAPPIEKSKGQPKKPMPTKLKSQMMARTLAASKATSNKHASNNKAYLS